MRPNQPFKSILKISLGKLDASKIKNILMIRMIPSLFEELLRGGNGLNFYKYVIEQVWVSLYTWTYKFKTVGGATRSQICTWNVA